MLRMEVDLLPEPNTVPPLDRIVQRLVLLGVPEENLEQLQPGLITFLKDNKFRIPEVVSAILPTDVDVMEGMLEAQVDSTRALMGPSIEDLFRESMIWLQWLMFEGEPSSVLRHLAIMNVGQRGVCGAVWGNNDIAYRCRTCEHDPTCAICVPCFQNGNHKDHDYSIIYTGGGCCDCGDVTAWKREGFCSKHKGAEQIQPLSDEIANSVGPALGALLLFWKNRILVAESIHDNNTVYDYSVDHTKIADELTSAVVGMLLDFCKLSESLLTFVSGKVIATVGLLDILVRAEKFLSVDVVRKLQELLLKLLSEPAFKFEFAKSFLSYYPTVVNGAVKQCSDTMFQKYPLLSTFSVQILTVPTLTPRLVKEMNLLSMLLECLSDIFTSCAGEDGRLQVSKWGNLYETTHRVVEDIRFVMSHSAVPKYVTCDQRDISRTWMKLLAYVQGMNPQKRETNIHIEEENDNMHLPFVLGHSIANIHALLVAGAFSLNKEETDDEALSVIYNQDFEDQDSVRHAKVGRLSQESSVCSVTGRSSSADCEMRSAEVDCDSLPIPTSVSWLTFECLRAIENWLGMDTSSGVLLSVLNPKARNTPGNNFFALKRTISKFRRGRNVIKANHAPSSTSRNTSQREPHNKPLFSPTHDGYHSVPNLESGPSDTSPTGYDDATVDGEYANELEAIRVLSLSDWPDIVYDVSSQNISVHIPLHRLLSLVLQKALGRCYGESASVDTMSASSSDSLSAIYHDFFGYVLGGCHPYGFSAFVMEHPLRIRVFCSEVHAGMWRKNGDAAILSYEWYRSVRWSEQGLELDLFLLQCCAALAPADLYVYRILERFGLSSFLSLRLERSSEYEPILVQEMLNLIIQIVKERRFCGLTTAQCLQRELIYKLSTGNATHSQLAKSLPRDLSRVDQLQEILDTVAEYSNPSGLNQGMYKLRLAYWKELDLYHPRWNSRDLQVAEERYLRFCNVSALTSQLPKWTKLYPPLNGLARIATCKTVLQIIRAVLFYALFTDKLIASRAPDGVLLTALHLLSLALDTCYVQKESGDESCYIGDSIPILAFAVEEISVGLNYEYDDQSLLSLLIALMRINKKENLYHFMEAGSFDLSSLIKDLLKKFAELDSGCLIRLKELAPEVVDQLPQSKPNNSADSGSVSDSDKRKAKARERQAAIMEKMRAQQSKFMANTTDSVNDESDGSKITQGVSSSEAEHGEVEAEQVTCSLCHDPNSKTPVSFLILLQKSRVLSLLDRGPPSWENKVHWSGKGKIYTGESTISVPAPVSSVSSSSEMISSSQLAHLIQNAVNEFASIGEPKEINAFLEFIRTRFPSVRNIELPSTSHDTRETTVSSLETREEHMYQLIMDGVHGSVLQSGFLKNEAGPSSADAVSLLLGKYIASLSKETLNNPSSSENVRPCNDRAQSELVTPLPVNDGFGPSDCDGIFLTSCGHAVHQGCLDLYLLSLKERYTRRMDFEGVHIVDPDQGEFLCPVCRGLANSVLPELPAEAGKAFKLPMISTASPSDGADRLGSLSSVSDSLRLQRALSLLRVGADVAGRNETLQAFSMHRSGRMKANLESVFHVLCEMYFRGTDKISGSGRVSQSMIMWDTLKYSLTSAEIAARSGKTSLTTNYGINALYKELKSSNGFIWSLLLKVVHSVRSKDSLSVLLRLRGIQLFAESICSGVTVNEFPSRMRRGEGNMLCILENAEMEVRYPDIQFWARASDPILARDAFSTLMWTLFCLPSPFLACEESFLSLVHIFYAVSITQAIITCCGKRQFNMTDLGYHDCLITDISKFMGEFGFPHQYFVSNYIDPSHDIKDVIRSLSLPYLRRCALLWKLINSSTSSPFSGVHMLDKLSQTSDHRMDYCYGIAEEVVEIEELEKTFKIPPLDDSLNDEVLRSLALKWLQHFSKEFEAHNVQGVLHSTPIVSFKLMTLPHLYQDLLQRYIKQQCVDCGAIQEEPALCLLCGKLCSPGWKTCCRKSKCQTHVMACGAGTGVFLLIRKTTILLQRSSRQARWPSPYLDAFGEEDIEMHRGKPLYLNGERYATLTHMVASHGLDRSSKVLHQTSIGAFLML